MIVRRATEPAGETPGRPAGLGAVAAAWTAGMGLFVLLVFAYYAAYDVVLPAGNGLLRRWRRPGRAGRRAGHAAPGKGGSRPPADDRQAASGACAGRGRGGAAAGPAAVLGGGARPGRGRAGVGRAPAVRVMSYNLHFGFDVSGWSDLEGVARAIEATGAEVVGLQEVSRGWYVNGATDMLAWLQRLRMPYARFAGASDAVWGNAVLSRYPIVAGEVVRLPREGVPLRRSALRAELDLGVGGGSGWS